MTEHAHWESIATFASGFEADLARQQLEAEGIVVMTKGPQVGVFGAGFQGTVGGGVELFVPSPEANRARDLLAG